MFAAIVAVPGSCVTPESGPSFTELEGWGKRLGVGHCCRTPPQLKASGYTESDHSLGFAGHLRWKQNADTDPLGNSNRGF